MAQWKCKHCGTWRSSSETPKQHMEICGGVTDDEAESLPEDDDPVVKDEGEDDWMILRE